MPYAFKKKRGYTLKKGKSGEMRWHKDPVAKKTSYKVKNTSKKSRELEIANRIFPGVNQNSFKMTPEELNLDVDPDTFYGNGSRLVLPSRFGTLSHHAPDVSYHGTRFQFDEFADKPLERPFHTNHWNAALGNHFSNDRSVSDTFANGRKYSGNIEVARSKGFNVIEDGKGRVIEVVLDIANPLVVANEDGLGEVASAYMLNKLVTPRQLDILGNSIEPSAFDEIGRIRGSAMSDFDKEMEILHILQDSSVSLEPNLIYSHFAASREDRNKRSLNAGLRFKKDRLIRNGFDGVVYKNDIEIGSGADVGLIPFSNKQIRLTHGERKSSNQIMKDNRWIEGKHVDDFKEYSDELDTIIRESPRKATDKKLELNSRFATINKARDIYNRLAHQPEYRKGVFNMLRQIHRQEEEE